MKSTPLRLPLAAGALAAWARPARAALVDAPLAEPMIGLAVLWLLLLGWCFHTVLRRHLAADDRRAALETQLAVERNARALAERALADTHDALCKLVREQEGVRETERNRIARDIHDDLGQNLLALKIELQLMELSTSGAHPLINQKLRAMILSLDLSIKSLRVVIDDLRPLALEHGLQHAIEWQLSEFSRINGIRHELKADPEAFRATGEPSVDAMLFRILQESLSNVVRHAHATVVHIALDRSADRLTMAVQDNGVGMDGHPAARGCGLVGIKDRITAIGGRFVIDSQPGAGTRLSLSIPLGQPMPAP